MATAESAAYDELLDLFVEPTVARRILAFHPSATMQARIETLLAKQRDQTLTAEERAELDEFERIEHFVRLVIRRAYTRSSGNDGPAHAPTPRTSAPARPRPV